MVGGGMRYGEIMKSGSSLVWGENCVVGVD